MEEKKEDNICLQFMESIENKFKSRDYKYIYISHYTSFKIDGIDIDICIEKNNNIYKYTMESIYIETRDCGSDYESDDESDDESDNLIVLEREDFKTVLDLLIDIKVVINSYHFLDHRLLSPDEMMYAKLQRSFFPLSKDNECSVCYECTTEYSLCYHPICFQCRAKCIKKNNKLCPVCRKKNLKQFPRRLTFAKGYTF